MSKFYKKRTQKEREQLFKMVTRKFGHSVINVEPPTNKDKIKFIRESNGLIADDAAAICGVSRKTWTNWENLKVRTGPDDKSVEPYPKDWQWGWFLLALNQHPKLQLVKR